MKIFDCFTYFNEDEMVRFRIEELRDVVDYFVMVEADQTFTGSSKSFYGDFLYDQSWFKALSDANRIIRVLTGFPHFRMTAWEREEYQRNKILQGIWTYAEHQDSLILMSDVDEIPRASVVEKLKYIVNPVQLDVDQYFWDFHWKVPQHCNQGARPVVAKMKHLMDKNYKVVKTPQELRNASLNRVPNAGWHFSFQLDLESIVKKIESFAHTEYNKEEYKATTAILYRIENGIDPFDRFPLKWTPIGDTHPKFIRENYNDRKTRPMA